LSHLPHTHTHTHNPWGGLKLKTDVKVIKQLEKLFRKVKTHFNTINYLSKKNKNKNKIKIKIK
jgi:hypothetical protein